MIIDGWENIIHLGSIVKVHGFDGAFVVSVDDEFELDAGACQTLFIEEGSFPVPFAVKKINEKGNGLLVRLEQVNNAEEAKRWLGRKIYAEKSAVSIVESEEDLTMLEGYTIKDEESGYEGSISRVFQYAGQWMLEVEPGAIWIPAAAEYFIDVDEKKRHALLYLPEGLIDLQ